MSVASVGGASGGGVEKDAGQRLVVDVSVVVPVVQADSRLREVVEGLGEQLRARGESHEFILVFDGVGGPALDVGSATPYRPVTRVEYTVALSELLFEPQRVMHRGKNRASSSSSSWTTNAKGSKTTQRAMLRIASN